LDDYTDPIKIQICTNINKMSKTDSPLIPSRLAKRATVDHDAICTILDEALVCTVSFASDNQVFSIPTSFVRYEDKIYIHGSVGSHFLREIEKGLRVCVSVTLVDALVVAKSAFHHSMNYRSVILFGQAQKIEDPAEKQSVFEWLTNKIVPGSWNYLRTIKANEIAKTTILAFSIDEASAKMRSGMPIDDEEDLGLPIWSGLIPFQSLRLPPVPDQSSANIPLPAHLETVVKI
jgi:uncharacterized protein